MVAAGDSHTVALSEAGHVHLGRRRLRGLGHGDRKDQRAPQVQAERFGARRSSLWQLGELTRWL